MYTTVAMASNSETVASNSAAMEETLGRSQDFTMGQREEVQCDFWTINPVIAESKSESSDSWKRGDSMVN